MYSNESGIFHSGTGLTASVAEWSRPVTCVHGNIYKQNGTPVSTAADLIEVLHTLREATEDESTFEGLRDSFGNAVGGLIEV